MRWLGVWSTPDEAINGLRNTLEFRAEVTPRMPILGDFLTRKESRWDWSGLRKLTVMGWAILPFRLVVRLVLAPLYNFYLVRLTDAFIAGRLADRSQGNDRGGEVLAAVTPGLVPGIRFAPLPGPIRRSLIAEADRHAALVVAHVREALGAAADEGGGLPRVLIGVRGRVGGLELVHTGYFDEDRVCELLARHVESRIKHAPARPVEVAPRIDRLGRWLAAARRRIAPAIRDGWAQPRARRPAVAHEPIAPTRSWSDHLRSATDRVGTWLVRLTPACILIWLVLLVVAVTNGLLHEFTDEYQIERIIAEAPVADAANENRIDEVVGWALTLRRLGEDVKALDAVRRLRASADRSDALVALAEEALKSGARPGVAKSHPGSRG